MTASEIIETAVYPPECCPMVRARCPLVPQNAASTAAIGGNRREFARLLGQDTRATC
jgi:hypothetical protein